MACSERFVKNWYPRGIRCGVAAAMALVGLAPLLSLPVQAAGPSANVSVVATGLEGPRGLKFGPDGSLYVAEAGHGGMTSTVGTSCEQVPGPVGPYTGGKTARISKIALSGTRTTVIDNLPSGKTSTPTGDTVGVGDIAFIGTTMYALIAGGGCSHGVPDVPAGVIRVNADGSWTPVADYSAFAKTHPVKTPALDDFEPDGTLYGMVAVDGSLYITEPNRTELDKVTLDGTITRVVEMSSEPWNGLTGLAYANASLYAGSLTDFPIKQGAAKIWKITPGGASSVAASGLTAVLSVAFDSGGQMYALEFTTEDNAFPTPDTGKVVRVTASGALETIATGLSVPTAMTFGPDGNLYVSNLGAAPPGAGQIVRITLSQATSPVPAPPPAAGLQNLSAYFIRRLGDG